MKSKGPRFDDSCDDADPDSRPPPLPMLDRRIILTPGLPVNLLHALVCQHCVAFSLGNFKTTAQQPRRALRTSPVTSLRSESVFREAGPVRIRIYSCAPKPFQRPLLFCAAASYSLRCAY